MRPPNSVRSNECRRSFASAAPLTVVSRAEVVAEIVCGAETVHAIEGRRSEMVLSPWTRSRLGRPTALAASVRAVGLFPHRYSLM